MTTITATPPKLDSEALTLKSTSLWQITWHRLFRRKSSVVGMIILALLVTIALTAQWLAPYSPTLSMLDVDPPQDIQKRSSPCIHLLGCPQDQPQHIMGKQKIEETFAFGGDQLLLQGGHHPDLGLSYYVSLLRELKSLFPELKLHALGPPEIAHITKLEKSTHTEVLRALKDAGLDSLPGAGAEILSDRVRRLISKGKCGGQEWLDVMRAAHQLDITTSATMMFGHIETNMERMEHFVAIRQVQSERPAGAKGFLAFIPWPFMDEDTIHKKIKGAPNQCTGEEYIRMIAMSRIMLPTYYQYTGILAYCGKNGGPALPARRCQ